MANAALLFHPDAFDTSGNKLMGRQMAGEEFLKGFFRHAEIDQFFACVTDPKHAAILEKLAAGAGPWLSEKPRTVFSLPDIQKAALPGTLHVPDPNLGRFAWLRRRGNQRDFSLTGVTHTLSSHAALDAIADLMASPVQSWDAVICTSETARLAVERMLDDMDTYLRERFGATRLPRPQLPLIPLGVHVDHFAPDGERSAGYRRTWRRELAIGDEDVVILFFGRLTFHSKGHPLPMLMGLELAVRQLRPGTRVHLVLAGHFPNQGIETAFIEAAKGLAPSVATHFVDGRKPAIREQIWHVADIFCSLADNIQESFGLTPIEAMAAGLPVIASDWDGYRSTLVHGETALLIPTSFPPLETGRSFAERHEDLRLNYDHYVSETSLVTGVDIGGTRDAFAALIGNGDLRRQMGQAGLRRARTVLDWSIVIRSYQALWDELGHRRLRDAESAPRDDGDMPANPRRGNPFKVFASYPSRTLTPDAVLRKSQFPAELVQVGAMLRGNGPATERRLPLAQRIFRHVASTPGGLSLADITRHFADVDAEDVTFAAMWLLKIGALEAA